MNEQLATGSGVHALARRRTFQDVVRLPEQRDQPWESLTGDSNPVLNKASLRASSSVHRKCDRACGAAVDDLVQSAQGGSAFEGARFIDAALDNLDGLGEPDGFEPSDHLERDDIRFGHILSSGSS